MKILVIGEINVDLILEGYHSFPALGKEVLVDNCVLTMGSASMICAMGLARLRNEVAVLGKVGCDAYGDFCLRLLEERGIDVSRVLRNPALKTGITVSITSQADRALVSYLGSTLELRAAEITDQALEGFRHLHMSSYFLQEGLRPHIREIFARARRRGMTTSLDPGYDPSEQWRDIVETLRETDLFFPNEVELQGITGCADPAEGLRALHNGRTLTIAKLGREGAMALKNGQAVRVPAFHVEVVDSTGAGDSFNAGFLHAWLRQFPLRDALRFGAACGALSTLGLGGVASQATPEQAESLWPRETLANTEPV